MLEQADRGGMGYAVFVDWLLLAPQALDKAGPAADPAATTLRRGCRRIAGAGWAAGPGSQVYPGSETDGFRGRYERIR